MKISIEKVLDYAVKYLDQHTQNNYKRGWYDSEEQAAIYSAQKQVMEDVRYLISSIKEKIEDGEFDIEVEREASDDVV